MGRWWLVVALLLGGCTAQHGAGPSPSVPPSVSPSGSPTSGQPQPSGPVGPTSSPGDGAPQVHPRSFSFVSVRTGWFLVDRACATGLCRALWQTSDAGHSFEARTAPPAAATQIRFADSRNGWAFNPTTDVPVPGLWRTADAGRHWRKVLDRPVVSLETARGVVWAVVLHGDGTGPQLYRGPTGGDGLVRVWDVPNRSAYLVLHGSTAYVVGVAGAGPIAPSLTVVTGTGPASRRTPPCDARSGPDFSLAVRRPGRLVAVCYGEPGAGQQLKSAFRSDDDGRSWTSLPRPAGGGYTFPGGLAATSSRVLLTGPRNSIWLSVRGGGWRHVLDSADGSGFDGVGMTDDEHGVVIGWLGAWLTADAGEHWRRLRFP